MFNKMCPTSTSNATLAISREKYSIIGFFYTNETIPISMNKLLNINVLRSGIDNAYGMEFVQ